MNEIVTVRDSVIAHDRFHDLDEFFEGDDLLGVQLKLGGDLEQLRGVEIDEQVHLVLVVSEDVAHFEVVPVWHAWGRALAALGRGFTLALAAFLGRALLFIKTVVGILLQAGTSVSKVLDEMKLQQSVTGLERFVGINLHARANSYCCLG